MNISKFRYREDQASIYGLSSVDGLKKQSSESSRVRLLAEAIQITPGLFPAIAEQLSHLEDRLSLSEKIDCFVTSDPRVEAFCVPHNRSSSCGYSVVLSSGLVERLKPDEVRFVVGHEVGHHLCEHWKYPQHDEENSVGFRLAALQLSRAAEISADRIGLVASVSLESACAAMIKVASGLGSPHVRVDIPSILAQFRQLAEEEGAKDGIWRTHPIIPLRLRALVRFDSLRKSHGCEDADWSIQQEKVDSAIESDFHRSTGNILDKLADRQVEGIRCWALVYLFCADGVITKIEQQILRETLGNEQAEKALRFLAHQESNPMDAAEKKLTQSIHEVGNLPRETRLKLAAELGKLVQDLAITDRALSDALQTTHALLRG